MKSAPNSKSSNGLFDVEMLLNDMGKRNMMYNWMIIIGIDNSPVFMFRYVER